MTLTFSKCYIVRVYSMVLKKIYEFIIFSELSLKIDGNKQASSAQYKWKCSLHSPSEYIGGRSRA